MFVPPDVILTGMSIDELSRLCPFDLQRIGLAHMSLICANGLPGAEDLNFAAYLFRLREWVEFVRERTPRFIGSFHRNPAEFNHSIGRFFMTVLVQILKRDIGVRYNPERIQSSETTRGHAKLDSRDLLINGPLGEARCGTCNNIPMIVVAVARELGYPVHLATTALHVYAKWFEPGVEDFNIEASNPAGMVSHPDAYYRDRPPAMTPALLRNGCYLRPLTSMEELALCVVSRGWVLEAHKDYAKAAECFEHACRLAPLEPMYPRIAARCVGRWMRETRNVKAPSGHGVDCSAPYQSADLRLDPQELLPESHIPLVVMILDRYHELCRKEYGIQLKS